MKGGVGERGSIYFSKFGHEMEEDVYGLELGVGPRYEETAGSWVAWPGSAQVESIREPRKQGQTYSQRAIAGEGGVEHWIPMLMRALSVKFGIKNGR